MGNHCLFVTSASREKFSVLGFVCSTQYSLIHCHFGAHSSRNSIKLQVDEIPYLGQVPTELTVYQYSLGMWYLGVVHQHRLHSTTTYSAYRPMGEGRKGMYKFTDKQAYYKQLYYNCIYTVWYVGLSRRRGKLGQALCRRPCERPFRLPALGSGHPFTLQIIISLQRSLILSDALGGCGSVSIIHVINYTVN